MKKAVLTGLLIGTIAVSSVFSAAGRDNSGAAGRLIIYSPNTEGMVNAIIPAFEAKTGVKVEIISIGTGEIWKRIESEKNSPQADVIWGGGQSTYIGSNLDLLEPYISAYNGDLIPQYQNIEGKVTLYCLDGSNLLVNKNLIGNIKVTSYADLLNPALKGKLIFGDPTSSSSAFAQLTNILLAVGGDYTSDKGWNYVRDLLIQLDGKSSQSSSGVWRGLSDGEYTVALTYEDPSATLVRDGAPVQIVYPSEGAVWLAAASGIIKSAKNMDNAKQFMDYIISKEAQDIFGTQLTARPVRSDAALGSYMTPIQSINVIFEDTAYVRIHRQEIIERYRSILTSIR
ncbi:iron(III)-binding protein [Spirochaetia bacterium]|nr:iron(III)-binding protein [Spirochaetia bacterium]